jgi:Carboxypeptidase regulatory-like domain
MKKVVNFLFIFLFCACLTGWAQDTAQIVGTVTDASGAVIPGAKVTVVDPQRGYTRDLVTNSAGAYAVSAVPIGTYTITAEATGFQKLVQSGITLSVGQIQRVDMQLKVGQVTQEVTVAANAPVVQTETAAISDVITGTQISNLNLNGRNFVTLALLVPGAVPTNDLNTSTVGVAGNNNISFNGSRTTYNNWEIDGGNNTDEGSASTFNTYPNLDTIAEFRISTSNYGADMGKHSGATIEVATKSGTRTFHGDAFEFVRRDWMDANDWFLNQSNSGKSPLSQHEYGYTFGGPFYIPGHYNTDKSKTFFFWSEDWRKIKTSTTLNTFVPSAKMRSGDFSECDPKSANYNATVADGCVLPTVNGTTYDNLNAIPGFSTSQAFINGKDLLDGLVPLPNSGPIKYVAPTPSQTNWRQEQIRVDQNISDKTQVFVRYTQDAWNTLSVPALWTGSTYDTITTPFDGPGKSMVLHITHSFTPTLMNEFIASYTVDHIVLGNAKGPSSVAGIDRPSNFQLAHFFPANDANTLLPAIDLSGGEGIGTNTSPYEDAGNHPWLNSNPIIDFKDNVVWSRGNHTIKFGFFFQDYRKNEQFGADTQGVLAFDNPSVGDTGNALANMFMGSIASYSEGTMVVNGLPVGGYPKGHWVNHDFEPYVNDDWRVNPHLTLNLGLRYYFFTRIHDISKPTVDSGFIPSMYDPAKQAQLDANANLIQGTGALYTDFGNGLVECGANGIPNGCQLRNTGGNWAPRFGFSWDPWGNGKTVVRGGYGIYYEVGNGNEAQTEGGEGNPPVSLGIGASNILGYQNVQPVFDTATGQYLASLPTVGFTAIPYDQKWGSVQQFSFGIQHQFAGSNILSVSYVGNLGRHLGRDRRISQIRPGTTTGNAPNLAATNPLGTYCGATDAAGNCVSGAVYDSSLNVVNAGDLGQALCDPATGNCNVPTFLTFNEGTSKFFQNFRGYNNIDMKENTAVSSYNALQINFRHPFGHGLLFQTSYTWSHNIDDSTTVYSAAGTGVDSSNLSRWKGTSDLNRAQVWQINYVYDLPFFKNASNGFLKTALSGWTISGITSFFTGVPIDVGGDCGIDGFNTSIGGSVRCNSTGPVQIKKGTAANGTPTWYDPSVLSQPTFAQLAGNGEPGMFGTMGRNVLTGPGRNNTDLALLKNFTLPWFAGEHSTIQLRLETFNSFNHPQWQDIRHSCSGSASTQTVNGITYNIPAFGNSCGGGDTGQVDTAWDPRILQFGLKFLF